ncbi:MAG: hypothetical protein R3F61_26920 [Myxococcota bacterium]
MSLYLTRISWNRNGWTRPQGLGPLAEGPARGSTKTFVSDYGYGHEEWLFRPEHRIDGWQYGFVQPALKVNADRYGEVLDAVLYTISPDGERFYLGRIDGIEILGFDEATAARDEFDRRGWSATMEEDLQALQLSAKNLKISRNRSREFVNVRFRPDAVFMLREPVLASEDDVTHQRGKNRYQFYPLSAIPPRLERTPADPNRPTEGYSYRTAPVIHADRRHNRLQLHMVELLRARFGGNAVAMEVDGVDIVVTAPDRTVFIEVKSEPDARLAVRAALGQLLEYALLGVVPAPFPELVIAAPAEPDATVDAYLQALRDRFAMPVHYIRIDETITVCPL